MRNDSVPRASDLRRDHTLHRVSHILGITFGNYEMRQARIEDLAAPKLLDILRDPVKEFQKAALSSRDLETARQLALIELAALVCWKAPHLLADALMEPELSRDALWQAAGSSAIEKKINLENCLQKKKKTEFELLLAQGRSLGKLMLLNRQVSYEWLNSLALQNKPQASANDSHVENQKISGICNCVPPLSPSEYGALEKALAERQVFQPWTHRLVEAISKLPYIKRRFPYKEYVQTVGKLEADGWLVRVYVNHDNCD
jgi:hypothetical protein